MSRLPFFILIFIIFLSDTEGIQLWAKTLRVSAWNTSGSAAIEDIRLAINFVCKLNRRF